jgi:hypothetical protein
MTALEDPTTQPTETPAPAAAAPAAAPNDSTSWAGPVDRLHVTDAPKGSMAATVEGRRLSGPLQGFGQLWQKTFRVRLDGTLEPAAVIAEWKARFPDFWPKGNTFYAPICGIRPGEVALLKITAAGPVKLNSGVMVVYADDTSFTLMTPEGHALAAWITFSAEREAATGQVVAQAQALERTSDPITELAYAFGANRQNDRFWEQALENFARHLGSDVRCETTVVKVDPRRQWRYAGNIVHNAGIRGMLWSVTHPRSWLRR